MNFNIFGDGSKSVDEKFEIIVEHEKVKLKLLNSEGLFTL